MKYPPISKPFFSEDPKRESFWLIFLLTLTALSAVILIVAWPFTRSLQLIEAMHQWRAIPGVEIIFRAFTFIGDDEFFMILFSFLIWCVNKSLGFWGAFVLLSSATFSNLVKDITMYERPPLEGVEHPPGSYAFPSGHTLTAVTVWCYLAARIKTTGFWIWTILAIGLIALSRMVLGYHYLADILGGFALGIPFILVFLWLSVHFYEKGWLERFSTPLLALISITLPVLLVVILPGVDPPKILGYLAGASFGYVIEKDRVRTAVSGSLWKQAVKVILGVAVLFGIIVGLGGVLPSDVLALGFIRYFLGGVWVTLIAPVFFAALNLSVKEKR